MKKTREEIDRAVERIESVPKLRKWHVEYAKRRLNKSLDEIATMSDRDILKTSGIGPVRLKVLRQARYGRASRL